MVFLRLTSVSMLKEMTEDIQCMECSWLQMSSWNFPFVSTDIKIFIQKRLPSF